MCGVTGVFGVENSQQNGAKFETHCRKSSTAGIRDCPVSGGAVNVDFLSFVRVFRAVARYLVRAEVRDISRF